MRQFILTLMLILVSICATSETIEKGRKLHPKANMTYCIKKQYKGNQIPPMSSIERVAWEGLNVYIKFYNQDEELATRINGKIKEFGDWHYLPLVIGGIGINYEDEKLAFFNTSNEIEEVFDIDIKKTADSLRLRE